MVKLPVLIIAICVCAAALGLWLFLGGRTSGQAPAGPSSDERARAKEFFAAPQKYDLKNGQEMRPRW